MGSRSFTYSCQSSQALSEYCSGSALGFCRCLLFKERAQKTCLKDKSIVTVTAVIFLMYPTSGESLRDVQLQNVGGIDYLQVDLEEPCYSARHFSMVFLIGLPQLAYVLGLPLLVLKFLKRNRADLFKNPVVLTRWGLFFKGYKEDRFYWELVITTRKVCVVALSVFGRELGVERQSQVALLLLLVCIILEIAGQPFREVTESHGILRKLEMSALLVEYGTLWCGLMIFQSGPKSEGMNVFMTLCVVLANIGLMLWFLFVLFRAYALENKDSRVMRYLRRTSRDQKSIRSRTFDAEDSRNVDNTVGATGREANPVVEMRQILKKVAVRSFERYETEDGEEFFVEVGTGESVWDLPEDGKVVA